MHLLVLIFQTIPVLAQASAVRDHKHLQQLIWLDLMEHVFDGLKGLVLTASFKLIRGSCFLLT